MVEKTKTGQSTAKFISDTLAGTQKAGKQAIAAGYPELSTYTKQYLAGLPGLQKYGTPEQKQALYRTGQLYKKYGDAGRYQKTRFGDIEQQYGQAGQYDPTEYSRSDYTTPNIQERMTPYEELVSQRAAARLKKGYDEARGEREAQAIRAGAFGGSGAAIQEEVARRNYLEQMADMNAQNLQSAYESAVNLYGKERADTMSAEQLEEASRQFGKQTQLAGLEGVMAARQQTAGQRAAAKEAELAGLQGQQEAARQQALLAEQRKNMRIADLAALQQGGQYQQDYNLQQRMYPLDVYAKEASIMGGMAGGYQPSILTRESQPSTFQNVMGGIGAGVGLLQGVAGLFKRDGGLIYRGGGLADLEPEYYDRYER